MEAQTLRIGNYYKWYADGKYYYFQVDNAFFMDINVINNSEPIELTEEILLKCGFSKNEIGGYVMYTPQSSMICIYKDGSVKINDRYIDVKIKHLHQLQNLYWCLCEKELTINL